VNRERWWLALAVALPRLLVFPFAQSLFGDAVVRSELAAHWAAAPYLMTSFAKGPLQFGPLHLMLVGAASWLWPSPEHVGRLVSLVCGVATVWPLHALTRRLFPSLPNAPRAACLAFALWGMHIQFSTTAASEALGVLCVVAAVAALARALGEPDVRALVGAAVLLTLACATRYDAWLLVPLFVVGIAASLPDSRRWTWAVAFGALASLFPVAWMVGNWVDLGDPLYPAHYIDDFHRAWFPKDEAAWPPGRYRLMNLVFWPGTAALTLSPLLAVAGFVGLWSAWRTRRDLRWLVAAIALPTLYFTVRSTLLGNFAPLARFTSKELALLLPFIALGAQVLRPPRAALVAAWALAVAFPLALGAITFRRDGGWADMLRPVSPVSTQPVAVTEVAQQLKAQVLPDDGVVLDADEQGYRDLSVAFLSGLPESRLARARWKDFDRKLGEVKPRWLVRFDRGTLVADGVPGGVRVRGQEYEELPGTHPPLHLYRAR